MFLVKLEMVLIMSCSSKGLSSSSILILETISLNSKLLFWFADKFEKCTAKILSIYLRLTFNCLHFLIILNEFPKNSRTLSTRFDYFLFLAIAILKFAHFRFTLQNSSTFQKYVSIYVRFICLKHTFFV